MRAPARLALEPARLISIDQGPAPATRANYFFFSPFFSAPLSAGAFSAPLSGAFSPAGALAPSLPAGALAAAAPLAASLPAGAAPSSPSSFFSLIISTSPTGPAAPSRTAASWASVTGAGTASRGAFLLP